MRIELNLEQGSQEWLDFRKTKRMASETPSILGSSLYGGPSKIREAKQGKSNTFVNKAMQQGHDQEPLAREWFAERHGMFRPAVYVNGEYGASVDGIDLEENFLLEIKTPFKDATSNDRWAHILKYNKPPQYDYDQIQHQLMVTGCLMCYYLVWDAERQEGIYCEVAPDPEHWAVICKAWDEFWLTLAERDDLDWHAAAEEYKRIKTAHDELSEQLEAAKKKLYDLSDQDFQQGAGVAVKKVQRVGTVNWKKVTAEHLAEVDLEAYRGKSTTYFKIDA